MADVPFHVIVAAFKDYNGASDALKALKEAKREKFIEIEDAAVITKDANGKVKIKETADMRAGKGAAIGAIAGGVIGLLAGPIGWAALGGGVIGGLAAKLHDGGFPDERLKQLGAGLTPESSALVAVIDDRWVIEVERELAHQQADVVAQALSDDIHRQLVAGEDVTYTVVGDGDVVVAERDLSGAPAPTTTTSTSAADTTGPSSTTPATSATPTDTAPTAMPASQGDQANETPPAP